MTYEESYRTFTDVESLMKEVARDVKIALFFGGGNLIGANLSDAYLSGAYLSGVQYNENTAFFALQCPEEGAFVAWKNCKRLYTRMGCCFDEC